MEKLKKARIQLLLEQPFYSCLLMGLEMRSDTSIDTAATDGISLIYNPEFIDSLTLPQLKGLLAHEVLHIALMHHTRIGHRDLKMWNEATDYAINTMLKSDGFELPEGGLLDSQYADMNAEQIYKAIEAQQQNDQQQQQNSQPDQNGQPQPQQGQPDKSNFGVVLPYPDKNGIEEHEQQLKQDISRAVAAAKKAGTMTAGQAEFIQGCTASKISWKEVLARFVHETAKNDYSWSKPNTRYLPMGLYLPHLHSQQIGNIILAIDTSGSIDAQLLEEFAGEAAELAEEISGKITVIECDTKVTNVYELQDELKDVNGRGGTRFTPVFNHIEENDLQPSAVVYFTDGGSHDFPQEPYYPVLWAHYGRATKYPFGEVVEVD